MAPCLGKLTGMADQFANSNGYSKDWAFRSNVGRRSRYRHSAPGSQTDPAEEVLPRCVPISLSLISQRQCRHAALWSVMTRNHSLTSEYSKYSKQYFCLLEDIRPLKRNVTRKSLHGNLFTDIHQINST